MVCDSVNTLSVGLPDGFVKERVHVLFSVFDSEVFPLSYSKCS